MPKTIRQLREERGWTRQVLAGLLGGSVTAIYYWERGVYQPRGPQLLKLAEVFDVPAEDILLVTEERQP